MFWKHLVVKKDVFQCMIDIELRVLFSIFTLNLKVDICYSKKQYPVQIKTNKDSNTSAVSLFLDEIFSNLLKKTTIFHVSLKITFLFIQQQWRDRWISGSFSRLRNHNTLSSLTGCFKFDIFREILYFSNYCFENSS